MNLERKVADLFNFDLYLYLHLLCDIKHDLFIYFRF